MKKSEQDARIATAFTHLLSGCRLARKAFQNVNQSDFNKEIECLNQVIAEADLTIIDILSS